MTCIRARMVSRRFKSGSGLGLSAGCRVVVRLSAPALRAWLLHPAGLQFDWLESQSVMLPAQAARAEAKDERFLHSLFDLPFTNRLADNN